MPREARTAWSRSGQRRSSRYRGKSGPANGVAAGCCAKTSSNTFFHAARCRLAVSVRTPSRPTTPHRSPVLKLAEELSASCDQPFQIGGLRPQSRRVVGSLRRPLPPAGPCACSGAIVISFARTRCCLVQRPRRGGCFRACQSACSDSARCSLGCCTRVGAVDPTRSELRLTIFYQAWAQNSPRFRSLVHTRRMSATACAPWLALTLPAVLC
jgi:hypothetical protein